VSPEGGEGNERKMSGRWGVDTGVIIAPGLVWEFRQQKSPSRSFKVIDNGVICEKFKVPSFTDSAISYRFRDIIVYFPKN